MNKTRQKIHDVIYEADTPAGKVFDISLIIVIIISVILVALETVGWINQQYYEILNIAEWTITILFTIEYILRVISIHHPRKYIFSFYGIIDLLATIPKYISLFIKKLIRSSLTLFISGFYSFLYLFVNMEISIFLLE